MSEINKSLEADSIIKNHVVWSMGAGAIPIPFADFVAVTAIQLDMVKQLARLYELDYKESEGKAVITALTGSAMANLGKRAVKFIPGIGSILGGIAMATLSGASTYGLGEVFKKHFDTGGTFLDFDPERLKKYYKEKFEKGKDVAQDLQQKQKKATKIVEVIESDDIDAPEVQTTESTIDKLTELGNLKKDGIITDAEFKKLKKEILDK